MMLGNASMLIDRARLLGEPAGKGLGGVGGVFRPPLRATGMSDVVLIAI